LDEARFVPIEAAIFNENARSLFSSQSPLGMILGVIFRAKIVIIQKRESRING